MLHPDTQLKWIDETIGFGVISTQFIPKGTIVWVLDDLDQRLDSSYVNSLDELRKQDVLKYSYRDRTGQHILCWDLGRFINHSSNPNMGCTAYEFELAVRDIYPGEELTDDYGCFNLDEPFECLRNEGFRTKIMPDDILRMYPEWDRNASEAMMSFNKVRQPLKHLISDKYIEKVMAVALGTEQMDSNLNNYWDRESVTTRILSYDFT